jgi:hypothetical protein
MYSVYQHWDPLETCIVGRSYPPEFYSWITDPSARSAMEKVAIETEEDFQALIKILESFNVKVLRPNIPDDLSLVYNPYDKRYVPPPMTPRDYFGSYGNTLMYDKWDFINSLYRVVRDPSWIESNEIITAEDLNKLPAHILKELHDNFNLDAHLWYDKFDLFWKDLFPVFEQNANVKQHVYSPHLAKDGETAHFTTAGVSRVGKDLFYGYRNPNKTAITEYYEKYIGDNYRLNFVDIAGHIDGQFCPVVPGLIIDTPYVDVQKYFPGWEVVHSPKESWDDMLPFMNLKKQNKGKWWIPGEENNNSLTNTVESWLSHWVGYVEETIFDVNMIVIDEQNVIVSNYNDVIFEAFKRYNITPHICNFRHRYFWDGGLHCMTSDLSRRGEMVDYFSDKAEH